MKNAITYFCRYYCKHLFAKFPSRLNKVVQHFGEIPAGIKKNNRPKDRQPQLHADNKSAKQKLTAATVLAAGTAFLWIGAILAWCARLLAKIMDILGMPELIESLALMAKKNATRPLNPLEIAEARRVFADTLPYDQIRIDEKSIIAHTGAMFIRARQLGVCTFHTINFTRKINPKPGNTDMAWLIHELVHVAQMQHLGCQYVGEALYAQLTGGYNYGGQDNLKGKKLSDFNREQQAEIARDFYYHVLCNQNFYDSRHRLITPNSDIYIPYIKQLQQGRF